MGADCDGKFRFVAFPTGSLYGVESRLLSLDVGSAVVLEEKKCPSLLANSDRTG